MQCSGICRYAIRCRRFKFGFGPNVPKFWLCRDHTHQEKNLRECGLLERES